MAELERLKAKINNARDLQSIVKIMKAISSTNMHEYELAVKSLGEYSKTLERGLQIVLMTRKDLLGTRSVAEKRCLGAVIFGSEQGLCGNFNERIARFAIDNMDEMACEDRRALAVGERVIDRLEEAGLPVEAHFYFSGDYIGISEVMVGVLERIEVWRLEKGIDEVVLFYNRPVSGLSSAFTPHMTQLFPLDLSWLVGLSEKRWLSRSIPTYSMDANILFSSLVKEYLFFSLYRAFVESLASENASRLSSMQAAERNIEEHLIELTTDFRRQRQEAISSELLDVITGFEALSSQ
ncbi:MAG: F0F1 ATP synthase subunit gamma [Methanotrichaceae archaeon]|nr:F0F1 ATP synthase subunit gamma [Methanotrichaceae archaeon]